MRLLALFALILSLFGCREERTVGSSYPTPSGNGVPVIVNGQYQSTASSGSSGQALIWDGGVSWGQAGGRGAVGACGDGGRPTATGSGNVYSCTDFPATYLDDPTLGSWRQLDAPLITAGGAASLGSYTSIGSIGAVQYGSAIAASLYANGSATVGWLLTPSASLGSSSTWIVELTATVSGLYLTQYPSIGLTVANGTSSGVSTGYSMNRWMNGPGGWSGLHMLQDTIGGARVSSNNEVSTDLIYPLMGDGRIHLRILADGTNAHFQIGNDGYYWWDWYTVATPSGLTHYGLQMGNDAATGGNSYTRAIIYKNEQKSLNVPQATVAGTTGNGVSPIVVQTSAAHGFFDGDCAAVHGVVTNTNANTGTGNGQTSACGAGAVLIHVTDSTHFQEIGTTGNGTYGGGGVVTIISR